MEKSSEITKTEDFGSIGELKGALKVKREAAVSAMSEYDGLLKGAFGKLPKNELELVDFIEKVMKHHEVIK